MKRLLCKLRGHSWTDWHLVHRVVKHTLHVRGMDGAGAHLVADGKPLYLYTRRCYRCGCEEFREEVGE